MASYLHIGIRFLAPYSHGRNGDGGPEWPPSPLRMFQAMVAAAAGRWNERERLVYAAPAFGWLETLPPPEIVACAAKPSERPYRLYVPDNVGDVPAKSWSRGGKVSIADYRTEKDVRPVHLDGDSVHYLYRIPDDWAGRQDFIDVLKVTARSMTHLGWGVDMVAADAAVITGEQTAALPGHRWLPGAADGVPLRTPKRGTLDDLMRKHAAFLGRIAEEGFLLVPQLRAFDTVHYRRQDTPPGRPYRVFDLRTADGSRFRYPHRRFLHIAAMVRHLAIEAMKAHPPRDVGQDWVETYVAGHRRTGEVHGTTGKATEQNERHQVQNGGHRQLSYVPIPSVGHEHADPGIRRVMLIAPVGDDKLLDYVARRLAGQVLVPLRGDEFGMSDPPILVPVQHDNVARFYTRPANVWHSFTPVILPGHDDHKPDKTRALILRALAQSDVPAPCEFEWSKLSWFRQSYSAHKFDRQGRPQGYVRPGHLLTQTAVHLTIRFKDGLEVPGPLTIGAGRHWGFGLMVGYRPGKDRSAPEAR